MQHNLYTRVALAEDVPTHNLRKGDVATIIEQIPETAAKRGAYVLEVFNAVGDSIDVLIVPETAVEALREDEVWHVREVVAVG